MGSIPSRFHTFFSCEELGDMMRNYPQSCPLDSGQQPSREIVYVGNGNNGRGRPHVGRGGDKKGN